MVEFLFCMTSMLFLAWVIVLKLQMHELKEGIEKLERELQKRLDKEKGDVDVTRDHRSSGHKSKWLT